jgi:hypothetical protein
MMLKSSDFPDLTFSSQDELFAELKKNESRLIDIRKTERFSSSASGLMRSVGDTSKFDVEDGFIYPIINTTNYMDSHSDVHVSGLWNKSFSEQQGKIYYVSDHDLSINSIIAFKEDVEMMLIDTTFKDLGYEIEGTTQALVFKIAKDKIQMQRVKDIIEGKRDIQHSVRMRYINIKLAMNSTNPDYADNKLTFDQYLPLIANKEKAVEQGYFYAVTEAAISKEGSMVLFGSNDITPLIQKKPSKDTSNKQLPSKDTTKSSIIYFY